MPVNFRRQALCQISPEPQFPPPALVSKSQAIRAFTPSLHPSVNFSGAGLRKYHTYDTLSSFFLKKMFTFFSCKALGLTPLAPFSGYQARAFSKNVLLQISLKRQTVIRKPQPADFLNFVLLPIIGGRTQTLHFILQPIYQFFFSLSSIFEK